MPGPGITNLGALCVTDPEAAKQRILDAIDKAEGKRSVAAALLGISERSFPRIVGRLDMWRQIDALCAAKGYVVRDHADVRAPDRSRA